jgi:hypothetical protein
MPLLALNSDSEDEEEMRQRREALAQDGAAEEKEGLPALAKWLRKEDDGTAASPESRPNWKK